VGVAVEVDVVVFRLVDYQKVVEVVVVAVVVTLQCTHQSTSYQWRRHTRCVGAYAPPVRKIDYIIFEPDF